MGRFGGSGNDSIIALVAYGDSGNDELNIANNAPSDYADGGPDFDTVSPMKETRSSIARASEPKTRGERKINLILFQPFSRGRLS